jgi:hypothetical protein
MKRLLLLILVGIYGCGLRNSPHSTASPAPIIATTTPTVTPLAPVPTAALGDIKNPLIRALAPAPRLDANALNASQVLITHLEKIHRLLIHYYRADIRI